MPPHGTTPDAVIANKIKLRSFMSSEHIYEIGMGHIYEMGNTAVSAS